MKVLYGLDDVREVNLLRAHRFIEFLQRQWYEVYWAPYILAKDREAFLQQESNILQKLTFAEKRQVFVNWADLADLFVIDVTKDSEDLAMIMQRGLDKPFKGLKITPIILIRDASEERHYGNMLKGVVEGKQAVYFEYNTIDNVMENWDVLLNKALKLNS